MAVEFNSDKLPFSLLNEQEKQKLMSSLDIGYYQKGERLMAAGEEPEGLFIILKGSVREVEPSSQDDGEHVFVHYGNGDYFGAWSALKGTAVHDFVAEEETIAHILPTKVLMVLVESNSGFNDYFSRTLKDRSQLHDQHEADDQGMAEFMLARVDGDCMREPLVLLQGTSILETTQLMREKRADSVLVRSGTRYGMVTGTDMLNAVVLDGLSRDTDVADIASYRLVSVDKDDYLFNALILMTQQHIERVVVMDGTHLQGVIELTDVLSYFSSHSHVIGMRIERAATIEDLGTAAKGLNELIRSLASQGVKARFAMDLISAMNEKVMAKLFSLLVPANLMAHVCLVVMGSEGRGEQIIKTDQDNALIMRDGLDWPEREQVLSRFSELLIEFGYPRCPGSIMVCNPFWVQYLGDWTQRMADWAECWESEAQMNLAIAVDAKPVAGNPALFKAGRNWFMRQVQSNEVFFHHFARPALEFNTPLTLFGSIKGRGIDIKKGGIFPIVHGIRTIALQHQIMATNTFRRIEQLVEKDVLNAKLGQDVAEALSIFIELRLRQQIVRLENEDAQESINLLAIDELERLDKDLLRESLLVVKEFKKHLELRYHL